MTDVLNPEPLLRALSTAGVQYIIIGGFAVNAHGVIRPSKDLDIVPDPDPSNFAPLAALLAGSTRVMPESTPTRPTPHSMRMPSKEGWPEFRCASAASTISSR